jgi:hypothetical protein
VKCTGTMETCTKESGIMALRLKKFLNPSTSISNCVAIRKKWWHPQLPTTKPMIMKSSFQTLNSLLTLDNFSNRIIPKS